MTRLLPLLLILAGPVSDGPLPPQLWFWDGGDCFPGKRADGDPPQGRVVGLGTVPAPPGAKPEALVVLGEDAAARSYEILVLYDGPRGGAPQRFRVTLP